jgi:hypothetical protein
MSGWAECHFVYRKIYYAINFCVACCVLCELCEYVLALERLASWSKARVEAASRSLIDENNKIRELRSRVAPFGLSPQPSRRVRRRGAAPLSGTEEQTARAISAHAQYACLISLQMGSIN